MRSWKVWTVWFLCLVVLTVWTHRVGFFLNFDWFHSAPNLILFVASVLLCLLFLELNLRRGVIGSFLLATGAWQHLLSSFILFPKDYYFLMFVLSSAGLGLLLLDVVRLVPLIRRQVLMFKGFFEESNELVVFYDFDGKIVDVNSKVAEFLGYHPRELVGKSVEEILHPDDIPSFFQLLNLMKNGLKDHVLTERTFVKKSGERIIFESRVSVVKDKKAYFVQEISTPIQERVKYEEDLSRERKRFQVYFNNTPVVSLILNGEGVVEDANKFGCDFLKVKYQEILGKSIFEYIGSKTFYEGFERAKTMLSSFEFEDVIFLPSDAKAMRWQIMPLEDGETKFLVVGVDVSKERELVGELERDKKFYSVLLKTTSKLLSIGWNEFTMEETVKEFAKLFEATGYQYFEGENCQRKCEEEGYSLSSKEIYFFEDKAVVPLEHEGKLFAVFCLEGPRVSHEALKEMLQVLKNQLELIYWKLKSEEKIVWLAEHDHITGVYNRQFFERELAYLLSLYRRHNRILSVVFIDLDDFKIINDTMGHVFGDRVLRIFAESLKESLRKTDILARIGGDEFGIILPETDRTGAETLLERLEKKFRKEPVSVQYTLMRLSFSYGISTFPTDGETVEDLLRVADERMYENKFSKKGL